MPLLFVLPYYKGVTYTALSRMALLICVQFMSPNVKLSSTANSDAAISAPIIPVFNFEFQMVESLDHDFEYPYGQIVRQTERQAELVIELSHDNALCVGCSPFVFAQGF